ncbi:hypothetical protein HELRODRAFT_70316 [Helobdella robusta]|uniref:RRM domain-containing protein n=1 Tax=Helobdella robusta TaxID=6412 RepID=T1G045_HELRO|nr:hypothetical protein HELRODRAFT_70316 [Helobdella robusta]ESN91756.1 hypothetical protein HELRODRAFT_70316 [Helobdella robusta]
MSETDFIVRLRGLPWSADSAEIVRFLEDCKLTEENVHIIRLYDGRSTGEAYVELSSEEDVNKAIAKNKKHLGKRYVDVHKAKRSEMEFALKRTNQSVPMNGKSKNVPIVKLRGLPFSCSKEEVANFFSGLEIAPNGITFITDHLGRCTGEGYVQFISQESIEKALTKHKQAIAHRYIEVFQCSVEDLSAALNRGYMGGRGGYYQHSYQNNKPNRFQKGYRGGYGRGGYYPMANGGFQYGGGGGGYYGNQSNFRGGKRPFIGGYKFKPTFHESSTGHSIFMKGLPFAATDKDIAGFFEPLSLVDVKIHLNHSGRPSGNASVDFQSHEDALEAMKKNKNILGTFILLPTNFLINHATALLIEL